MKLSKTTYIGIILSAAVPLYVLYLWLTVHAQHFIFGNISWLLIAAERLLNGDNILNHIYETNPPLSILIYTPHILVTKITSIPTPLASFWGTSIMAFISLCLSANIIKFYKFLDTTEKYLLTAVIFIATTLLMGIFLSEREHLILIWLIPFILCQFAITEKIDIPKYVLIPSLAIGAIFILVKPHYGIIPTVLLLARMIQHRKFIKIIFDADFLILSIATLGYVISIFLFLPDYIYTILPDVIHLYAQPAPLHNVLNTAKNYAIIAFIPFLFEITMDDIKDNKKRFLNTFYICLLFSFIPYFVQMKGYQNHLLPVYGFTMLSLAASIILRLDKMPKNAITTIFAPSSVLLCVLAFSLYFSPLSMQTLKHKDAQDLSVTKYIQKECPTPCTFFAFHSDIEIFNPLSIYTKTEHGTRFPAFWFLPVIFGELESDDEQVRRKAEELQSKYTNYVAQDLQHYKPDMLLIIDEVPLGDRNLKFNEFFANTQVMEILNNDYKKYDKFVFSDKEYYKGTTFSGPEGGYKYDVYKRLNR